jgi:hypothetical protein
MRFSRKARRSPFNPRLVGFGSFLVYWSIIFIAQIDCSDVCGSGAGKMVRTWMEDILVFRVDGVSADGCKKEGEERDHQTLTRFKLQTSPIKSNVPHTRLKLGSTLPKYGRGR